MLQSLQQTVVLSSLLLVVVPTSAFSTSRTIPSPSSGISPSPSVVNAGVVLFDESSNEYESNEFLVSRATACVHSESCSLEEAESYLNEMLLVRNNPLDGGDAMTGSKTTECADVVEGLRKKIEAQRKQVSLEKTILHVMNVLAGVYVVSAIFHDLAFATTLPIDSPMLSSSPETIISGGTVDSSVAAINLFQDLCFD